MKAAELSHTAGGSLEWYRRLGINTVWQFLIKLHTYLPPAL